MELYSALHPVGDLVGVLDALGIASAVLVGHDRGADVAARAAVMRPDRFHALVLPKSGHFAAWEPPELFVEEVRATLRAPR